MSGGRNPFWLASEALLLASGSPARAQLLQQVNIPFDREKPLVDERAIETRLRDAKATPAEVALALARAKALDVAARNPGRVTLGSDQTLDLEGVALNKPVDRAQAREHLRQMSGRAHHLHSAVAVACDSLILFEACDQAIMTVRPLTDDFLERYLDLCGDAILASVGAYQIEGLGAHLFERIDGEHATIVGLPLVALLRGLRQLGLLSS